MSTSNQHQFSVVAATANGDLQDHCQEIYLTELTAAQYLARMRHYQKAYERARLQTREFALLAG